MLLLASIMKSLWYKYNNKVQGSMILAYEPSLGGLLLMIKIGQFKIVGIGGQPLTLADLGYPLTEVF